MDIAIVVVREKTTKLAIASNCRIKECAQVF